jgi:hypothetical protein
MTQWKMVDRLDAKGNPCGINIANERGEVVCRMPDGATTGGGHAWPEQISNARLIASAPSLLEIGVALVQNQAVPCESLIDLREITRQARQALARVRP